MHMVFSVVWWREGELVGKQAVIPIPGAECSVVEAC